MPKKTSFSSAANPFPFDPLHPKSSSKLKRQSSKENVEKSEIPTLSSTVQSQSEKNTRLQRLSGKEESLAVVDTPQSTKQKRLSLQQEHGRTTSSASSSPRRNTIQINNNDSPKSRKNLSKSISLLETSIAEDEVVDIVSSKPSIKSSEVASFTIEEERKSSKLRQNGRKPANSYDENVGKLLRNDSVNNSIKSSASKLGSVQSLEVVREQYCCLQRKTKLERTLSVTVFVLSVIVIILIVVIIFMAKHKNFENLTDIVK